MLKIFEKRDVNIRLEVKVAPLLTFVKVVFFLGIAVILATRDLYIATDDFNYLNYFYNAKTIDTSYLLTYLIEEPLWRLYTVFTTLIFSPENALRATLFISCSLFLFSTSRVNKKLSFLVFFVFIMSSSLATQMYFNQIRQGLALSLFLLVAIYGKRPIFGAILATFIHTSFFFPLAIVVLITQVESIRSIIIYSIIIVLALYLSIGFLESFDLGRRTENYEFEGDFTINYYISAIVRYVPIFFLIGFHDDKEHRGFWFKVALSAFIIFLPFTFIYSAAVRIMYYFSVFVLLMILENYGSLGGKLALFYYVIFLLIQMYFLNSQVIERWDLILSFNG